MKKKIVLAGAVVLLLVVLSGCQQTDAAGNPLDKERKAAPSQILPPPSCHTSQF